MTISERVRAGVHFYRLLALACLLSLMLSSTLSAQTAMSSDGQQFFSETTLSEAEQARYARVRIQLMTIGPGPTYWERFGHNAIIVTDPDDDISISYNYGMFDFGQENFMLNFLRGYMVYRMDTYAGDEDIRYYLSQNRAVHLQTLNLTPLQKKQLLLFTNWNLQP